MCLRPVLYPSDDDLLIPKDGIHVQARLNTSALWEKGGSKYVLFTLMDRGLIIPSNIFGSKFRRGSLFDWEISQEHLQRKR